MRTKLSRILLIGCASVLFAGSMILIAQADFPTLWTNWVVANASVTPSPFPTGYAGEVVVAQATNAAWATPQPGTIDVMSSIIAGGSNGTSCSPNGSLCSSTSASAGKLVLGGSSTYCGIDYGYTTASFLTLNCNVDVGGSVSVGPGGATCTSNYLCTEATNSTGALLFGGATHSCIVDFGVTTSLVMTVPCSLTVGGTGAFTVGAGTLVCTASYVCDETTASTGGLILGGQTHDCLLDYGITTSLVYTMGCSSAVAGYLQVGSSANDTISGDVNAARSASTGELKLGGSSGATMDYGLSASGVFGFSAPIYSSGYLQAGSTSNDTTTGDVNAARSASTGAIKWGGSSGATIDYGVTTASKFTIPASTNITGNATYSSPAVGCTSSSNLPCGGNATCTLNNSTPSTCTTANITLPTTSVHCTVSYDYATAGTQAQLVPAIVHISSSTLTLLAELTVASSGTASMDYTCI